jgi:hypothetical protein
MIELGIYMSTKMCEVATQNQMTMDGVAPKMK